MPALTEEVAGKIYDILVEGAGAPNYDNWSKLSFIAAQTKSEICTEYRFCGSLGFGGKFWRNREWYVTYYPENKTPEREIMIKKTNVKLEQLLSEFPDPLL